MAKSKETNRNSHGTKPKFPYTTRPASLRRLLSEIPKRPKPARLTLPVMKTWKVATSNDATALSVLKKLGLLGPSGDTLQPYADFMQPAPVGPRALAARIRETYRQLFETSHEPQKSSNEQLRTFFNINSGGGERAIDYQIQTFKALCEYADFSGGGAELVGAANGGAGAGASGEGAPGRMPPVQIDLHIHLPENKTSREYEAIIQDIAKYIYGRSVGDRV